MTRFHPDQQRRFRSWALAIAAIVLWFLAATNSAEAESHVPAFVVAQALGAKAAEQVEAAPAVDPVRLVAGRMAERFEDQLVAGVSRPSVELEVHFDFDSSQIHEESHEQIEAAALMLKDHFPSTRFRVAGYTDSVGAEDYNQRLSEERAAAVWQKMVEEHGVSPDRLQMVGYGENDPVTDSTDAQRRRVELQIVRSEAGPASF